MTRFSAAGSKMTPETITKVEESYSNVVNSTPPVQAMSTGKIN